MLPRWRSWQLSVQSSSIAQLCLTLCNPMDCCPPGSSIHGLFQLRILEWVAISSSKGSSWPSNQNHVFCVSCIGSRILYHRATWEAQNSVESRLAWFSKQIIFKWALDTLFSMMTFLKSKCSYFWHEIHTLLWDWIFMLAHPRANMRKSNTCLCP